MVSLEWKEPNPNFSERLAMAKEGNKLDPNCYSTAFFLLGVIPYDVVMYTESDDNERLRRALSRMIHLKKPRDNSLIISFGKSGRVYHASYLLTAEPFFGYQRVGKYCGPFMEFHKMDDIEEYLNDTIPDEFAGWVNGRGTWRPAEAPYSHKFYTLNPKDNLRDWAKGIVREYRSGWNC